MNFTLNSSFPDFETLVFNKPDLGNQLFELQESELEPITWAAGLEMEGTYILNPLDSDEPWSKGLKQFYIPDINQIMDHIDKTYGKRKARNKYIYIPEAEVSGRTCAGVSVIKPDPKKSMLEIATDDPYTLVKNPMADKNDLLYYAKYLIEIQENSIRDLNEFYYKETLWKKKKKY